MEPHLVNATSTAASLHYQLTDLWGSPRGTVLRIEALALVAIAMSFFLAAFGSCRRWSNSWIVQKGFLAAQVLSLSLGTYSIGLMQSSSVKNEMYPIWAVSLLTLFGCVDPINTYIGLDYKGPLSKIIFQLCLYCGYVLLMSISTISSVAGNLAIGILSAITFIKGFHRSMALVLPSLIREEIGDFNSKESGALVGNGEYLKVCLFGYIAERTGGVKKMIPASVKMAEIHSSCNHMGERWSEVTAKDKATIEDVCLAYSLSHLLQRHFLGLDSTSEMEEKVEEFESLVHDGRVIDYKKTLQVIEIELAFLYEVFFTSNEFLHFYQAKVASIWALASFVGICFVGVAVAIPGTMASRHRTATAGPVAGGAIVVDTTMADLIITLTILVSLAMLQLLQLVRCWTSNFARVAFACEYAIEQSDGAWRIENWRTSWWRRWMRLKAFVVTRRNWFDRYLWQDKLGQHSLHIVNVRTRSARPEKFCMRACVTCLDTCCVCIILCWMCGQWTCRSFFRYLCRVLQEVLLGAETGAAIRLHDDVKTSVTDFLCQIKSRRTGKEWSSLFDDNGIDASQLPYNCGTGLGEKHDTTLHDFGELVMVWQIATWYCEQAEEEAGERGGGGGGEAAGSEKERNRRVAMALSKYCAYLIVSAPQLLPRPTKNDRHTEVRPPDHVIPRDEMDSARSELVRWIQEKKPQSHSELEFFKVRQIGVYWGRWLCNESPQPASWGARRRSDDPWKVLALVWVQTLLYAAPYGDAQVHLQRLSQGGEFITHLRALLYHLGIDRWEREPAATGGTAGETTEEQPQEPDDAQGTSSKQGGGEETSGEITEETVG